MSHDNSKKAQWVTEEEFQESVAISQQLTPSSNDFDALIELIKQQHADATQTQKENTQLQKEAFAELRNEFRNELSQVKSQLNRIEAQVVTIHDVVIGSFNKITPATKLEMEAVGAEAMEHTDEMTEMLNMVYEAEFDALVKSEETGEKHNPRSGTSHPSTAKTRAALAVWTDGVVSHGDSIKFGNFFAEVMVSLSGRKMFSWYPKSLQKFMEVVAYYWLHEANHYANPLTNKKVN